MKLTTVGHVQYRPEDEEMWHTGTVERDSNGRLYIQDDADRAAVLYPSGGDEVKAIREG